MWGLIYINRFSQICVYKADATEEKIYRLDNNKLVMEDFFVQLGNDCKIAIEATGRWYW